MLKLRSTSFRANTCEVLLVWYILLKYNVFSIYLWSIILVSTIINGIRQYEDVDHVSATSIHKGTQLNLLPKCSTRTMVLILFNIMTLRRTWWTDGFQLTPWLPIKYPLETYNGKVYTFFLLSSGQTSSLTLVNTNLCSKPKKRKSKLPPKNCYITPLVVITHRLRATVLGNLYCDIYTFSVL